MDTSMDIVNEVTTEVDQKECNLINLKELSQSIDEIVVTPDIYLFFTSPTEQDPSYEENNEYLSTINNEIYKEIMDNKISFMTTNNHLQNSTSTLVLDEIIGPNKALNVERNDKCEMDTKSLPGGDNYTYLNMNLKINNNEETMSLNEKKINKLFFNKVLVTDQLQHMQSKVVNVNHRSLSNLIHMYCSKCKKVVMNYLDKKCYFCTATLLFQCKNCSCVYKRLVCIQNHIKYECYKNQIFQCADCNYKSINKIQLRKHIRNEHPILVEPQKFFKCLDCHRRFKIESNMLAHEKTCSRGMIMQCKYCTFTTKFNNGLAIHMLSKHSELNPENYYQCPECGKKFKNLRNLNRHIISLCGKHLNFGCDHCKFRANRKYELAKHMQQNHSHLFLNKFF